MKFQVMLDIRKNPSRDKTWLTLLLFFSLDLLVSGRFPKCIYIQLFPCHLNDLRHEDVLIENMFLSLYDK